MPKKMTLSRRKPSSGSVLPLVRAGKLITCILPKGTGLSLVQALREEKKIDSANLNTSRGSGMASPVGESGIGGELEKDVVTVAIDQPKLADEIFEYIFHHAEIDRPHGGFMYQTPLMKMIPYKMPAHSKKQ